MLLHMGGTESSSQVHVTANVEGVTTNRGG
jgi:hypothetical protein